MEDNESAYGREFTHTDGGSDNNNEIGTLVISTFLRAHYKRCACRSVRYTSGHDEPAHHLVCMCVDFPKPAQIQAPDPEPHAHKLLGNWDNRDGVGKYRSSSILHNLHTN